MPFRAAGIEGLRGVAALAVVVAHTIDFMLLPGLFNDDGQLASGEDAGSLKLLAVMAALGVHGVTVFFVISGFLLYRPFVKQVSGDSRTLIIREFLRNRLLRIFPAYLVVFVLAAFVVGVVVTQVASDAGDDEYVGRMTDPLLIVTNLTLTQGYLPQGQLTGLGASWSLVPELAFYLLLPFVWLLSRRLAKRMPWQVAALVPVGLMLLIGIITRLSLVAVAGDDGSAFISASTWRAVLWHSIIAQGDLFALGMVVAVLSVWTHAQPDGTDTGPRLRRIRRIAWPILVLAGLFALPAKLFLMDAIMIGLATAAFITILSFDDGKVAGFGRAFLAWKPVDRAGMISYSLYLWHVPVIFFLREHYPSLRYETVGGFAIAFVLVMVITWVLSEITYALVERPALARKRAMVRIEAPSK